MVGGETEGGTEALRGGAEGGERVARPGRPAGPARTRRAAYFAVRTSAIATSPTTPRLAALILSIVSSPVCQYG